MGIVAVDPKGKIEYIPESEKGEDNPTKFFYTPMTEREKADMAMSVSLGDGQIPKTIMSALVFQHVVGWENFNDAEGNAVKFSRDNISRLPWEIMMEIGAKIFETSGFLETERKN